MTWISTNKVLPQDYKDVLIWIQRDEIGLCKVAYRKKFSGDDKDEKECYTAWYLNDHDWIDDKGENRIKEEIITHWMPLPNDPNSSNTQVSQSHS